VRWEIWYVLVANLLLSPIVKEFLKSANISQSYERISSGTFFTSHGVFVVYAGQINKKCCVPQWYSRTFL